MKKLFGFFGIQKPDLLALVIVLCALAGITAGGFRLSDISMEPDRVMMGYMAVPAADGSIYVIDSGKSRVLKIQNGSVKYSLDGTSPGGFYQAENLCVDPSDGSIYVQSVDWDMSGYLLASERILHYSSAGKYLGTPIVIEYRPEDEVNKHRVFDIRFLDGKLSYIYADDKRIEQRQFDGTSVNAVVSYPYADAWVFIQNFAQSSSEGIYALSKNGKVLELEKREDPFSVFYHIPTASKEIPFFADMDEKGDLILLDIYHSEIKRLEAAPGYSKKKAEILVSAQKQINTVHFGKHEGQNALFYALDNEIAIFSENGKTLYEENTFPQAGNRLIHSLLEMLLFTLMGLCILYLILRISVSLFYNRHKVSKTVLAEAFVAVCVLGVSLGVMAGIIIQFSNIYFQSQAQNLSDMAVTGSNMFDAQWLSEINTAADFMNPAYKKMSDLLHLLTTDGHSYNGRYGAQVDRVDEDGRAYSIVFTDNSIGTYYPLDEDSKADVLEVMHTGKPMMNLSLLNAGGTFIFGRAPIFDEAGNAVAVISIAQDSYRVKGEFREITSEIAISVMLVIVLAVFLSNEGFAFIPERKGFLSGLSEMRPCIIGKPFPMYLVRIGIFAVAFVLNMTSSFLSVYTFGFWTEDLGIPQALAGAVPLFSNGIFVAVSALFCAPLVRRIGFRNVMLLGVLCSGSGDLLAGLSRGYAAITVALLLNGLGFGILMNSLSMVVGMVGDELTRQSCFAKYYAGNTAGINSGMIAGAFLASVVAYHQVFYVTSALWFSQSFLFVYMAKKLPDLSAKGIASSERERPEKSGALPLSQMSLSGLVYILCISLPYAIMGSFMYYYVPICTSALGYSEKYASLIMIVSAMCGIFLGNALTTAIWKHFRLLSLVFAIFPALGGWLLMSAFMDIKVMAVGILITGMAFSFGQNVIVNTFLSLKSVERIAQDAMGIYMFFGNIGSSVSSIICGAIMSVGMLHGMSVYAIICVALFAVGSAFVLFRERRG